MDKERIRILIIRLQTIIFQLLVVPQILIMRGITPVFVPQSVEKSLVFASKTKI